MNDWWEYLSERWWPKDAPRYMTDNDLRLYLTSKRETAERLRPSLIGEIGVRAGYCAFSMLSACPDATYLGFDVNSVSHHTELGSVEHARELLSIFPNVFIIECDSHQLTRVPAFDLLHVDGDHSHRGCTLDLELARRSNVEWVLADDYNKDIVRGAVDAFVRKYGMGVEHVGSGLPTSGLLNLKLKRV